MRHIVLHAGIVGLMLSVNVCIRDIIATPTVFASLASPQGVTSQQIFLIGDVHKQVATSAPIEREFINVLNQIEACVKPQTTTVLWECGIPNSETRNTQARSITRYAALWPLSGELFYSLGSFLSNYRHNVIQVKNIENRSFKMMRVFKWLINDSAYAQSLHKTRQIGDGSLDGLLHGLSFDDIIAELDYHIARFESLQKPCDATGLDLLGKICSLRAACKAALGESCDTSIPSCVLSWHKKNNVRSKENSLYRYEYQKEALFAQAKHAFLAVFDRYYWCGVFDLNLYHAIRNDPNNKIIVVAGATHVTNVAQLLMSSGYDLVNQHITCRELFTYCQNLKEPAMNFFAQAQETTSFCALLNTAPSTQA